jgi:hypothetical protein
LSVPGRSWTAISPWPGARRYLAATRCDDLFLTYADVVVGMLTPHERIDLGYEVLDARERTRTDLHQPGAADRKQKCSSGPPMREAVAHDHLPRRRVRRARHPRRR